MLKGNDMHPLLTRILYPGWIPKCEQCGKSNRVVEIQYGYPSDSGIKESEKGNVVLGGCIVHSENPNWYCKRCELKFKRER